MRRALFPALLAAFVPVWADSDPLSGAAVELDAVRRDPLPGMVTPAPELRDVHFAEKRALTGSAFMGYFSISGFWYTHYCPAGEVFAADPTWGACCSSSASQCNYATACVGNEVVGVGGGRANCGPSHTCDTITLLNSRGVANTGVRSVIQCFGTADFYDTPKTWYRQQFDLTTTSPTKTRTTAAQTVTQRITVTPNAASSYLGGSWKGGESWLFVVPLVMTYSGVLLV